jgi:hypothetical protein
LVTRCWWTTPYYCACTSLPAVGSERENASAWVPTDVVTQLDFICLLAEKKLANVTATLEELELAKVGPCFLQAPMGSTEDGGCGGVACC